MLLNKYSLSYYVLIVFFWYLQFSTQNPNNSLIPEVLKWMVMINSAILIENEKLHFKLFLPNSTKVAKVGTGGFSNIGVTCPAPIWTIGKALEVSNCESGWSYPTKSATLTSGKVMLNLKFFYKKVATAALAGFKCNLSNHSKIAVLNKSAELVFTWAKM